ncbi:ribbon-helix-helix protein, CopG family, partial [Acinetobacter baumannii]
MAEKLTASVTFKCTDEEKILLERIARSRKQTVSELMRERGIDVIREVQELLQS